MNCDILIKNTSFLNENFAIVKGKNIAINNGKIESIFDCLENDYTSDNFIDGKDIVWMPGLVDGHLHTSQQLLRGRLLDERPVIWKRINIPHESKLTEEGSELSSKIAALEMIKSGTTGFVDIGGKYVENFASVYEKSGLRCALTYMTNDNPFAPESLRTTVTEGIDRLIDLYNKYENKHKRMKVFFSVPSLTVASEEMITAVFSEAKKRDIPVETHMNEYSSEVFEFIEKYQLRPFEYLEKNNLIGKFIAAHCIFLSETEIEIIKNHDVKVIHCPFSNSAKGVPRTPQLLANNISVGFGTDGSGHGGLDLFKDMRLFRGIMNAVIGTGSADYQIMPSKTLLKIATQGGSNSLFSDNIGKLKEGYFADLIGIDLMQPHIYPTQNLVNSLVESVCGNDVKHMIVHGNLIMKNREIVTMDEEKILYEMKKFIEDGKLEVF
ncbi:amidohydrolase family protein [Candidatus Desulfosporosinus nitrosoreducens]|uniref:amidohydrolase family protein n=1 Tax=Candidatus Desulfosporosinus nitrosoreducens TaxID=3401928 RepID=UPI00280BFD7A|nr:amidohydrolase family protein [Desulfosporosinus sp. PR]